jgi:glutathione S-transferase
MSFFKDNAPCIAGFGAGIALSLVVSHIWTPPWCKHERARDKSALPEVVGYRTVHKHDVPNRNHTYKLTYFNVRGLGEPARLIFALANVPYEDNRYPFEFKKGAPPEKPQFDADAAAGKFNHAMGQIPILEVDGKLSFGQSKAIERYLARQFGLFGEDEAESGQVDAISEHIRELQDAYRQLRRANPTEEKEKAAAAEFIEKQLPGWLKAIEDSLVGVTGYSVGSSTTLPDVLIYHAFLDLFPKEASVALRNRPKLSAINDRLASNPRLQDWVRKRPDTVI